MNFAPFDPLDNSYAQHVQSQKNPVQQQAQRDALVQSLGPTARRLDSVYLNGCSYYYVPDTNKMFEISVFTNAMTAPSRDIEMHLRQINNLPAPN